MSFLDGNGEQWPLRVATAASPPGAAFSDFRLSVPATSGPLPLLAESGLKSLQGVSLAPALRVTPSLTRRPWCVVSLSQAG